MNTEPLIKTNPYLKAPDRYRKALIANVASSSAVETGAPVESIARTLAEQETLRRIKRPKDSAR
jgi:hypothetical protein